MDCYYILKSATSHFLWLIGGTKVLWIAILWTYCHFFHIQLSRNIRNSWFKSQSNEFYDCHIFRFFYLCINPVTALTIYFLSSVYLPQRILLDFSSVSSLAFLLFLSLVFEQTTINNYERAKRYKFFLNVYGRSAKTRPSSFVSLISRQSHIF